MRHEMTPGVTDIGRARCQSRERYLRTGMIEDAFWRQNFD